MLDSATSPLAGITPADLDGVSSVREAPAGRENAGEDGAFARVLRAHSAPWHGERGTNPTPGDAGDSGNLPPPDRREIAAASAAASNTASNTASNAQVADAQLQAAAPPGRAGAEQSLASGGDGAESPAPGLGVASAHGRVSGLFPMAASAPPQASLGSGSDAGLLHRISPGALAIEGPSSTALPPASAGDRSAGDRNAAAKPAARRGAARPRVAAGAALNAAVLNGNVLNGNVLNGGVPNGNVLNGGVLNGDALGGDVRGRASAGAAEPEAPPGLAQRALAAAQARAQAREKAPAPANTGVRSSSPDEASPDSLRASPRAEAVNATHLAVRAASVGAPKLRAPAPEVHLPAAAREAPPAGLPPGPATAPQGGIQNTQGGASNLASAADFDLAMQQAPSESEFVDELGARVQVMLRDGVRKAHIQLQPAELGRLQVMISMEGDQARVAFLADAGATRDAIEQSLPRLREMLEQNGLQLAQSDLGQRGFQREESRPDGAADARGAELPATAEADADRQGDAGAGASRGRIDTYI